MQAKAKAQMLQTDTLPSTTFPLDQIGPSTRLTLTTQSRFLIQTDVSSSSSSSPLSSAAADPGPTAAPGSCSGLGLQENWIFDPWWPQ